MALKQNPIHGDLDTSPTGIMRKYDANTKTWGRYIPEQVVIAPDTTNTNSLTKKIWSGTLQEYNSLGIWDNEVIYFVKE